MNLRKFSPLFVLIVLFVSPFAQAQLPIQNARWRGVGAPGQASVGLTFRQDTLLLTAEDSAVITLRYEQAGDTLRLQFLTGSGGCGPDTATYQLRYGRNGEQLTLQPLRDDCPARRRLIGAVGAFSRVRGAGEPPRDWPYLDPTADSVAGISLYRAYELLRGRSSVPVVVGILDSGVDLTHEDLADVAWVNRRETPDNQVDDDQNGYPDDRNGWNFMGAPDGTTYEYDQPEITQTYVLLKPKYDQVDSTKIKPADQRQYLTYQAAKRQFLPRYRGVRAKRIALADTARFWQIADQFGAQLPGPATSPAAIRAVDVGTDSVAMAVRALLAGAYTAEYGPFRTYVRLVRQNWVRFRQVTAGDADIAYNPDYNARLTVGDNPADPSERQYGSPRMRLGASPVLAVHGSHVAGIVGAKRGNGRGIDGVADNVRLMPVSVVPANGDERDKDVANGIRYAVENGAKVINMSFGKRLSPFKEQVDAAIRFAEERDVLIVHAAGNNGENHDSLPSYPSARYANGQTAQNVLVVGNSTWRIGEGLASRSSNYGAQTVDLFAPGTGILSTLPHNRYASLSGTSMAAPHTAGVAALLRSYFPALTAVQVKDILLQSAYRPGVRVRRPGRLNQLVPFRTLSRSGGLLNAYEAVKLAMSLSATK